jgi:hypothetical protein
MPVEMTYGMESLVLKNANLLVSLRWAEIPSCKILYFDVKPSILPLAKYCMDLHNFRLTMLSLI